MVESFASRGRIVGATIHARERIVKGMSMASFRKKGRFWYYRFTDKNGQKVDRKGHWDLPTTRGIAATAETETTLIRGGLICES
jgi:hypothetical protein